MMKEGNMKEDGGLPSLLLQQALALNLGLAKQKRVERMPWYS